MTKNKNNLLSKFIIMLVLSILFFVCLLIVNVVKIQGNSRVINYSGIVRGGTQRIIKLEISDIPSDDLITYIDNILYGLENGGGEFELNKLSDQSFQNSLKDLKVTWNTLKNEINLSRQTNYKDTNLIFISEEHFELSNEMVNYAEIYTEKLVKRNKIIEYILIVLVLLDSLLIFIRYFASLKLAQKNIQLKKMAYTDVATGLANKTCCIEYIQSNNNLDSNIIYACIMFDLNNLKTVNDNYGHIAGDNMIKVFSDILIKSNINNNIFIGRYGGDEFIGIMKNTTESHVNDYLNLVKQNTIKYNCKSINFEISYAVGYAITSDYDCNTMENLLKLADEKMYNNKTYTKNNI